MTTLSTTTARVLTAVAAAAIILGVWAVEVPAPLDRAITIPIVPGKTLRVWALSRPQSGYGLINRPFYHTPRPAWHSLWIGVWIEDQAAGTTTRLAGVTLPIWPLLLGAMLLACGLACLWLARLWFLKQRHHA